MGLGLTVHCNGVGVNSAHCSAVESGGPFSARFSGG